MAAEVYNSTESAPPNLRSEVVNGVVDFKGLSAKRSQTGYWRSASIIIGVGVAERFAYYGISTNLITYLTGPLGQSTAVAASNVNTWVGTGSLLPLLGAFLADSYLGRYWTTVLSSLLYISALGMLTVSAMFDCQSYVENTSSCPSQLQLVLFFISLYLVALAQGAHKPCLVAFGADQFDGEDPKERRSKSSFFNWWYFGLCAGPLTALLVINYVQDNVSWVLGFGIPCISMAVSLVLFFLGSKTYRYVTKVDEKSPLSRIGLIFSLATANWRATPDRRDNEDRTPPNLSSKQFEFLKKPLIVREGTKECDAMTVGEIEEAKAVLRLFPIWFTSLGYAIVHAQTSTLFTEQGVTMDRFIKQSFEVPAASLQYLIGLSIILFIPIYDRVFVPMARAITGNHSGITKLQRIGIGMVLCSVTMVIAALVEKRRLKTALIHKLVEFPEAKVPMSFCWLIPQYVVFGISDVFTGIGLQELFYDQAPRELKCIGLSLFLSIFGIGSFLSSLIIFGIEELTSKGGNGGWFPNNLNQGHLDYFYWLLAGIISIEFVGFIYFAKSYKYRNQVIMV